MHDKRGTIVDAGRYSKRENRRPSAKDLRKAFEVHSEESMVGVTSAMVKFMVTTASRNTA